LKGHSCFLGQFPCWTCASGRPQSPGQSRKLRKTSLGRCTDPSSSPKATAPRDAALPYEAAPVRVARDPRARDRGGRGGKSRDGRASFTAGSARSTASTTPWASPTSRRTRLRQPPNATHSRSTHRSLTEVSGACQNTLAGVLTSQWLSPRSPGVREPQYDLAWIAGEQVHVAEVKSLTRDNEEHQLRLGLGQVLRYRHVLSIRDQTARAVLAVEQAPIDSRWSELCRELGVVLCWPPLFDGI
jgi:hypothetical protein